tara:strand:+ start:216 stop:608 length:393 start_codon:yes stop_codon:yes gene_type:complete
MGVAIKFRKGTATEHASFEGQAGEVTVQTNTTGLPWSLRVHDGDNASGYWVAGVDDVATLTNKTLTNVVLSGTVKDTSGNLLGTISGGKLVLGAGTLTLDEPSIIDQGATKDLEAMVSRVSRKNQMILGD